MKRISYNSDVSYDKWLQENNSESWEKNSGITGLRIHKEYSTELQHDIDFTYKYKAANLKSFKKPFNSNDDNYQVMNTELELLIPI